MKKLVAFLLVVSLGVFFAIGCNRPAEPKKPLPTKVQKTPDAKTPDATKTPDAKKTDTKLDAPKDGPVMPEQKTEPKTDAGKTDAPKTTPPPAKAEPKK